MSTIDALTNQILGQNLTSKWSGEGFGSAEANARGMAEILSGIGITNINQFGKVPTYEPVRVMDYSLNGQTVYENPGHGFYMPDTSVTWPDGEGGTYHPNRYLSAAETQQLQPKTYGKSVYDPEYGSVVVPVATDQIKNINGQLVTQTGENYGNKVTGQVVPSTYGERQTDSAWGGTFAGSGNTGFRVQFDPNGNPYFYTTAASSNDLANLLGDNEILNFAANVAAATFGGPAGVAALQLAQGKDIEDAAKAAAISYAGGQIASGFTPGVSEAFGGGTAGKVAANAVVGGTMAELQGGDFLQGALQGSIAGGINQAANEIKAYSAYTPNADGSFTYQWDDGSQITVDNQANVLGYAPSGDMTSPAIANQQAQQDIKNKLGALNVAKTLTPYAVTALLSKNAYDLATQDEQGNYNYPIVPVPSDWKSPQYNQTFTPSAPIDFGSPDLLQGTQWDQTAKPIQIDGLVNTLNNQYIQPQATPQFGLDQIVGNVNNVPMSINDIINNIGNYQAPTFDMGQNIGQLNGAPASLSSIIAGIQGQYGQETPS